VRIVTPGSVMEDKTLESSENNFIVSLAEHDEPDEGKIWAIAAADLSTGELYVTEFEADRDQLFEELNAYEPAEAVTDDSFEQLVHTYNKQMNRRTLVSVYDRIDPARTGEQLPREELDRLSTASRRSIDRLLGYLFETQRRALHHIRHIRHYEKQQFMIIDPFTRRNLELTETVRDRSKKGSLLWLLDKTVTAMGGRMLRRW